MKGVRPRGFTLIEMLVALALVSLMLLAMFQAYRFSQRTLLQATKVDAAARDVAAAQRLLRRVLENAYPFEAAASGAAKSNARGLMGTAQRLEVTAPALAAEGSAGLYRFAVSLGEEKGALAVRWAQDRNGGPGFETQSSGRHEVILSGVQLLSIRYLELVELGNGEMELNWRDSWMDNSALPALIRVRLKFAPDDQRIWPELIVAPRISTDANCVFDVVSQICRITS